MRLIRLTLSNFKGASSVELTPRGSSATVYGDNATGKTTLADAWFWLLFGKDSENRADFDIKTTDRNGNALSGLDHMVEAELDIDGSRITLGKVYKEVYTKKRGSALSEFSGHTTDYFVNTVPQQKKDFDARVAGICSEKTFRLLTDPTFFCTQLAWQDRRKALLTVCGDVSDFEVISANPSLADLPKILGSHSIEEYRKILANTRKAINDELNQLPTRIDEVRRGMPAFVSTSVIDSEELRSRLRILQEKRSTANAGGLIAEKQVEVRQVEAELINIENRLKADASKEFDAKSQLVRTKTNEATEAHSAVSRKRGQIADAEGLIKNLEVEMQKLREKFALENAKQFEFTGVDSCAACGQDLPTERVEAARLKALEEFNGRKSETLESIKADGMTRRVRKESLESQVATASAELERLEAAAVQLDSEVASLKAELENIHVHPVDPRSTAYYKEQDEIRARLNREIDAIRQDQLTVLQSIDTEIAQIEKQIHEAESAKALNAQCARDAKRIAELEAREKELAAQFEQKEAELFLTEEFIKAKVSMLTDRINSKFTLARFKLFEQQVNGGVTEVCEATFNGVPYGSLNHGSRVNVGLDIINTLAEFHQFAPPIFIDNAESVTSLIPTKGQQIRLVVSATDKSLRFETGSHDRAEVAQGALI